MGSQWLAKLTKMETERLEAETRRYRREERRLAVHARIVCAVLAQSARRLLFGGRKD